MRSRPILAVAGVAALSMLTFLLRAHGHEGHGKVETAGFDLDAPRTVSSETAAVIGLQTAEVDFGAVDEVLRLTGVVRPLPDRVEVIAPRITGVVAAVHVRAGDQVRRGDVVAEIDSPEYLRLLADLVRLDGRAAQLAAEIDAARQTFELASEEVRRVEANPDVVAANLVSEKRTASVAAEGAVRAREAEQALVRAETASLQKLIESIRRGPPTEASRSGRLALAAAIDGVVVERAAVVGMGAEAGQELLRVADYSTLQIEGELPESLVPRLGSTGGQPARIRAAQDRAPTVTGIVRFISPVVDPVKRTTHVVIEAENPGGALRDGQYVDLAIVLRQVADAVVVPASAVLSEGPMRFVFMKEKGNVFRKHDIALGVSDDLVVEVVEGLAPGDVVVTQGAYSLTQLRPKAAAAAAGSR